MSEVKVLYKWTKISVRYKAAVRNSGMAIQSGSTICTHANLTYRRSSWYTRFSYWEISTGETPSVGYACGCGVCAWCWVFSIRFLNHWLCGTVPTVSLQMAFMTWSKSFYA